MIVSVFGYAVIVKKKKKQKKNIQRVVHNPKHEFQWGETWPFSNPLFYILGLIFTPVWYFDAVDTYGGHNSTALFETFLTVVIGWPIVFLLGAKIIEFLFVGSEEVANALEKRTNKVEEKKEDTQAGPRMTGTAFFIDQKGHLITNFHVIDNCGDKLRAMCDRDEKKCRVIAIDKSLDLALLKVNYRNENYVQIDDKTLSKMQPIIAAGYPALHLSDDLKLTSGIISSLKGFNNNSALIQIDAALNSGNSGGPIIDKEDGNLAAVAVARMEGSHYQSINYGVKSSRVKEFIESNNIKLPKKKIRTKKIKRKEIADNLENTTVLVFH